MYFSYFECIAVLEILMVLVCELATLQKTNPGIIMSVKSQHAVRRILSIIELNARNMRRDGFLDEGEAEMITKVSFL
jgi:hypothetical protein